MGKNKLPDILKNGLTRTLWIFLFVFEFSTGIVLAETVLSFEFSIETHPHLASVENWPPPTEDFVNALLEEARFVYSGIIFGWTFSYTPSDVTRNVNETFELVPIYEIPKGYSGLMVQQTWEEGQMFHAVLRLVLDQELENWLERGKSNIWEDSGAVGMFSSAGGYPARLEAITQGLKLSIRAHARKEILNKPELLQGEIRLTEKPYIVLDGGDYNARVSSRIFYREKRAYQEF